jgi:hypothetical protein
MLFYRYFLFKIELYIEYIHKIEVYILMGEGIYGRIQMIGNGVNRFISGKGQ